MRRDAEPSPRVRLEVAFLDAQQIAPAPAPSAALDEQTTQTVLVVAAEADLRRYVRECLRERTDLRVIEAATVADAVTLGTSHSPKLIVVDEQEREVLGLLSRLSAIVIVDDEPRGPQTTHVRLLARPFTGEELVAEVDSLGSDS